MTRSWPCGWICRICATSFGAPMRIVERSPIDVLVNNAGGMFSARLATPQGLERTFSVNYLGHYLLSRLLLASLGEHAPSHIVNVSSIAHRFVRDLRWDDLQLERRFSTYQAYSQSKLAQVMFTRELARRLDGTGVVVNAAHPGAVRSRLAQDGDSTGWVHAALTILTHIGITPETAARTPVMLTSVPPDETGGYWSKQRRREPSRAARDAANGERLWTISEELIQAAGIDLPPVPNVP